MNSRDYRSCHTELMSKTWLIDRSFLPPRRPTSFLSHTGALDFFDRVFTFSFLKKDRS
ncbi:MAG: hypothetical protein ACJARO_000077 [Bacteriovoracaceae bacterium]|jgi:hypothetical protein